MLPMGRIATTMRSVPEDFAELDDVLMTSCCAELAAPHSASTLDACCVNMLDSDTVSGAFLGTDGTTYAISVGYTYCVTCPTTQQLETRANDGVVMARQTDVDYDVLAAHETG